MNLTRIKTSLLVVMIAITLFAVYYYIRVLQQHTIEDATYSGGLRDVTLEDEYKHDVPEWGEFWAPVYLFKDADGVTYKWGDNFENVRIESITMLDNQTIRIYGEGIEFVLKPEIGYRRVTIDSNFLNSDIIDHPGWSLARVGDIAEFYAYSANSVFWQNRGQPLTSVFNLMHYQVLGNVTLKRGGQVYMGVGSFQHLWMNTNFYILQQSLSREDAFHVFSDKFVLFIEGAILDKRAIQDGCVYFFDDGSYDVLGMSVKGYPYQIADGPMRLSYAISAESHKGKIEVQLMTPTDTTPMTKGFQQVHWAEIQVKLDGKPVGAIMATSETIRT